MAGTVTATYTPRAMPQTGKKVNVITVAWTSDASGNADATLSNLYGYLVRAVTDPDGTAAPTDNYDITLVDDITGTDAAQGTLSNRDTSTTEDAVTTVTGSALPVFLCGDHTFTVANAGNAKSGVAYLFIVEEL